MDRPGSLPGGKAMRRPAHHSYVVRFNKQPMRLTIMGGKNVAETVKLCEATKFTTEDDASQAAVDQFGDGGMEHVTIEPTPYAPTVPAGQMEML
jgi:hypothetical protein